MKIYLVPLIVLLTIGLSCKKSPNPPELPEAPRGEKPLETPKKSSVAPNKTIQIEQGGTYASSREFVKALRDVHNTNYLHDVGMVQLQFAFRDVNGQETKERTQIVPYNFLDYTEMGEIFILPYFFKFQKNEWGEPQVAMLDNAACHSITLKMDFEDLPTKEFILFQKNPAQKLYAIAAKNRVTGPWTNKDSEYTLYFPTDYSNMGDFIYAVTFNVWAWDPIRGFIKQMGTVEVQNTAYIEM
jgi:hypothetical protein